MFTLVYLYKTLRTNKPNYLAEMFSKLNPGRPATGVIPELAVLFVCTDPGIKSFQVQDAHL